MTDLELLNNQNIKKLAIKFFPDFFTIDNEINWNKSIELLNKNYEHYLHQYSYIFNGDFQFYNSHIEECYRYIKMFLKEHQNFEYNKQIIIEYIYSYKQLKQGISNYHFDVIGQSIGSTQNQATKYILECLNKVEPALYQTINNINKVLNYYTNSNDIDTFYVEIINRLKNLITELNYYYHSLISSEKHYKEISLQIKSKSANVSYNDLGKARNEWRKNKNKACCYLFNMYKELKELNLGALYRTFDFNHFPKGYDDNQVSLLFDASAFMILESPYAACFWENNSTRKLKKN